MRLPRRRGPSSRRPEKIVGLVDLGSSKIACLIVAVSTGDDGSPGDARVRCLGAASVRSRGVRLGGIADAQAAELDLRAAVAQAEQLSGIQLDRVTVAASCGGLHSQLFSAHADLNAGRVEADDVARLTQGGRAYAESEGRTLIHMNRIGYRLDEASCDRDPVGQSGQRLIADLHAITADTSAVQDILAIVDRCYLKPEALVASPFASGLGATTPEERDEGVTVVDIGGLTTSLAMFTRGKLVFADVFAGGGAPLTADVARGLQTPHRHAERIKALHGTAVLARSDAHEVFTYPLTAEADGEMGQVTRAELASVIAPRLCALIGEVASRIESSGLAPTAGQRIVLTGGTAQLVGLAGFSANVLGRPVRASAPDPLPGLPSSFSWPGFAAGVGLARLSAQGQADRSSSSGVGSGAAASHGYLGRVSQWLMGTG